MQSINEQIKSQNKRTITAEMVRTDLHLQAVLRAACTGAKSATYSVRYDGKIDITYNKSCTYEELIDSDDINYGSDNIYDYNDEVYAYYKGIKIMRSIDRTAKIPASTMELLRVMGFVKSTSQQPWVNTSIVCERSL
ncbi:MAG: hypothetical protein DRI65_13585 [Chloroflexota bacterium]|nr:MAG: hypothetical protein DRI65_13585 [Chloroflexota bacterium]